MFIPLGMQSEEIRLLSKSSKNVPPSNRLFGLYVGQWGDKGDKWMLPGTCAIVQASGKPPLEARLALPSYPVSQKLPVWKEGVDFHEYIATVLGNITPPDEIPHLLLPEHYEFGKELYRVFSSHEIGDIETATNVAEILLPQSDSPWVDIYQCDDTLEALKEAIAFTFELISSARLSKPRAKTTGAAGPQPGKKTAAATTAPATKKNTAAAAASVKKSDNGDAIESRKRPAPAQKDTGDDDDDDDNGDEPTAPPKSQPSPMPKKIPPRPKLDSTLPLPKRVKFSEDDGGSSSMVLVSSPDTPLYVVNIPAVLLDKVPELFKIGRAELTDGGRGRINLACKNDAIAPGLAKRLLDALAEHPDDVSRMRSTASVGPIVIDTTDQSASAVMMHTADGSVVCGTMTKLFSPAYDLLVEAYLRACKQKGEACSDEDEEDEEEDEEEEEEDGNITNLV